MTRCPTWMPGTDAKYQTDAYAGNRCALREGHGGNHRTPDGTEFRVPTPPVSACKQST